MKKMNRHALLVTFSTLLCIATYSSIAANLPDGLQNEIFSARDKVLPALVHIQPVLADYRTGRLQKQSVVGSGVVVHPDGYVVTNFHVAGKAREILCTMYDKEQLRATLVGGDPLTDLAVIKLDLTNYHKKLTVAEFGASDSLEVGQFVMAMGSPLALSRSVSCGVISTIDRYFSEEMRLPSGERTGEFNTWLQTDAAINPGNSGGPLVDLHGKVVGINSRATLFANSIGFSIPSNVVKSVVNQLITGGKVVRSWVGIRCQALQDLENWFGADKQMSGALIASVDPQSPAEKAKLRAGDIIESINGVKVSARFTEEIPRIYQMIAEYPPNSKLTLGLLRHDKRFTVPLVTQDLGELQGEDLELPQWGFTVKAITQQMVLDYQLDSTVGVFVSGVKRAGPAASGGLQHGDVIMRVDDTDVNDLATLSAIYDSASKTSKGRALLTIRRGGATRFALIKTDSRSMGAGEADSTVIEPESQE